MVLSCHCLLDLGLFTLVVRAAFPRGAVRLSSDSRVYMARWSRVPVVRGVTVPRALVRPYISKPVFPWCGASLYPCSRVPLLPLVFPCAPALCSLPCSPVFPCSCSPALVCPCAPVLLCPCSHASLCVPILSPCSPRPCARVPVRARVPMRAPLCARVPVRASDVPVLPWSGASLFPCARVPVRPCSCAPMFP